MKKYTMARAFLIIGVIMQMVLIFNLVQNHYIVSSLNQNLQSKQEEEKKLDLKLNNVAKEYKTLNLQVKKLEKIKKEKIKRDNDLKKQIKDAKKIAYLTFDDGPSSNTSNILDILKSHNIKATFFVKGNDSKLGIEMYKRIVNEGHSIGNHTYSHEYSYIYSSKENFIKDFNKLEKLIKDVTGVEPNILRFPGGSNNTVSHNYGGTKIMRELVNYMNNNNLYYFDWNVDSTDASVAVQSKEKIVNNVLRESDYSNKVIILMHDSPAKITSVKALPEIIQGLKNKGFKFDTLSKDKFTVRFLK